MILVDLNQVMISNLMAQIGSHTNINIDEGLLRHMVLNAIRGYRKKFVSEYGELVICCDDTNNWRKKLFPYYKANRKKTRDDSELDWPTLFTSLNKVRDELKEFFPYKHLQVHTAEADDIIGVLCYEYGTEGLSVGEPILILSGDKDFIQLQKFANVNQYDPVRKKMIRHSSPELYTVEHICKGDRGDGIPNVLSNGDVFVSGGRQKPLRAKALGQMVNVIRDSAVEDINDKYEWAAGYHRNRFLVDLQYTPADIKAQVLSQFAVEPNGRGKLFNYFVQSRLNNLVENISEF
jgi:hypothetical protein